MPKDYVRRSKKKYKNWNKTNSKKKFPWISSLVLIVLMPLFTFGLSVIKKIHIEQQKVENVKKTEIAEVKPQKTQDDIHFEFYTLLPKATIDVSESYQNYTIQIASLSELNDAKKFKKGLKDIGFNAKIYTIKQGNKEIYRIQIGPFRDKKSAQNIHAKLQTQNINSVIINNSRS